MSLSTFGSAKSPSATKALLLGSGELGKEVAIELQRFGIEVVSRQLCQCTRNANRTFIAYCQYA